MFLVSRRDLPRLAGVEFDIFDEYFYVDERGFRDYKNADRLTQVIKTPKVIIRAKEADLP